MVVCGLVKKADVKPRRLLVEPEKFGPHIMVLGMGNAGVLP